MTLVVDKRKWKDGEIIKIDGVKYIVHDTSRGLFRTLDGKYVYEYELEEVEENAGEFTGEDAT